MEISISDGRFGIDGSGRVRCFPVNSDREVTDYESV
jgi:hypothetical protein